ncbi:MAG: GNAT family N-acetyltransferase [Chloroflexi bacterium]|nr:GNAT family N-acetyltransferase [Chloroflexota bacterium]
MSGLFDFGELPVLETERLTLRPIGSDDAEAILRIRGDIEVTRLYTGQPYQSITDAESFIASLGPDYEARRAISWGITLKEVDGVPGEVIGLAALHDIASDDRRSGVRYELQRAYWGRGIASEALRAVLTFAFDQLGLNRVEASCAAINAASVRALKRLGFTQEGQQRERHQQDGVYYDRLLFGLLAREFQGASEAA